MVAHQSESLMTDVPVEPWYRLWFDKLMVVAGLAGPIMTIPQVYTIYSSRSAEDLNPYTWAGYVVVAILWMIYGIVHRSLPLIAGNIAWVVSQGLVVVGAILYRGG